MIYYDIQHHGDYEQLIWLSKVLDDKNNILNFSLDMDNSKIEEFKEVVHNKNLMSKIFTKKSLPVIWCGPSQIRQMRDSLEKALEKEGWEYYINLSGTCFPLTTQQDIKDRLIYEKKINNKTSFCSMFVPKKESLWILNEDRSLSSLYHDYKYKRLTVSCDEIVLNAFKDETFNPVNNVMHRRGVHCSEVLDQKKLLLRSLEKWEVKDRQTFWNHNTYRIGRTWVILHRKQIEWLVTSKYLSDMYNVLIQMFEPDESFFQSLLFTNENPYYNELSNDNLRYKFGNPGIIDFKIITDVLSDDSLFARKLSLDANKNCLNIIEKHYMKING